ncbi:PREDICTED: uncharacterized protein LOC109182304 [Ipomoea nil]|uniref:uncharacterized protein LOC109182304 n=1 Tax=Ipomoea nil TaxID=35883 RepID=UPI0009013250|nr:PREDICTED: uncharacterized protein LOC109182304 [Ipomoea nil]XP_019187986.1 PREDICTED: uncharacterized protein LOC109182304 [Ipomoea nil]XP_019187987.1 PREDICTED: uncharacterized protein LOC109182304 [Ipomoea nil]
MWVDKRDDGRLNKKKNQPLYLSKHSFNDLSHVSPVVFLYLLKECYVCGTCKATTKFRALQQVVVQVLYNGPQPGPAVFAAQCLYVLPIFESYCEGFSHLILSALRRFMKLGSSQMDILDAKIWAAKLFLDIVGHRLIYDERIMVKIVEVFNVNLSNIGKAICGSHANNEIGQQTAKIFVQQYILNLIDCKSYMTAVSLLEQFSLRGLEESFLLRMMDNKDYKAAEKWATFMGKQYLCTLVQEYIDRKLEHDAYEVIRKNNLREEFPEAYHQGKESKLKKLAEKGCWDIAEARTKNDRQLLEYLVYLAMEAGYMEKVEELCNRYSLEGFTNTKELEASAVQSHYLQLKELSIEEVVWVDNANSLQDATHHIEECKVVGLDCEWKPNYEKGSLPNKVSIMQIASERKAYILDLIKLYNDVPDILDDCLVRILHSPRILKLGYNFQCDVAQLARSYGRLECFKHYDMLLDIQNVFKEPRGGLSGLAKKILGTGLNKTRRNSNWEQRPLTQYQLEYAALDAVVLIHIFRHVRGHTQPAGASDGHNKIEWKSHIVSHMDNSKKAKKETKKKEQCSPTSHGLICLDAEFEQ